MVDLESKYLRALCFRCDFGGGEAFSLGDMLHGLFPLSLILTQIL